MIAAAENVASRVRSLLHFSVPDEGPLSDADTYMPDFMKLLASYQRLMAWRQPEGYDPAPAGRQHKPFRARLFRPDIVSKKEAT